MRNARQLEYPLRANSAGWDNEPRIYPRAEAEVTFTYAVIADGGIVLVADSQMTHTHRDQLGSVIGTYEGRRGKIMRLGERFSFSICGNGGLVDTLLAEVDEAEVTRKVERSEPFEKIVQTYELAFRHLINERYKGEQRLRVNRYGVAFLFCGFVFKQGKNLPQIAKLDIADDFLWNPLTTRDHAATGSESHGAAYYLHHRFYRDGMPLEQAKLLAYCIAKEVADQDNSVGGPIEMEVITPDGSHAFKDLEKYEAARKTMIDSVASILQSFQ